MNGKHLGLALALLLSACADATLPVGRTPERQATAVQGDGRPSPGHESALWRDAERTRALLHARKAQFAARALAPSLERHRIIRQEEHRLADALDRLSRDEQPRTPRGWREEAYLSPLDNSPQPFVRYLPFSANPEEPLPLVVHLHGYSPYLNLLNWMNAPAALTNLAERLPFALVMPFGRSNTDFQGIGEQDVFRTIDLMAERYGVDTNRVVLSGFSMGGMGVWTIGTRFAERFNGLLPIAARGDYYEWKGLDPERVPPWRQRLIDDAFPRQRLQRLSSLPILSFQGDRDSVLPPRESQVMLELVRPFQPKARHILFPGADHWIDDDVFEHPDTFAWLQHCLQSSPPQRPAPLGLRPGQTPSRLQNGFLDPFAFVIPPDADPLNAERRVLRRADEWDRFAKAPPRVLRESELTALQVQRLNLFVFGEPEHSPLVRAALRAVSANWDREFIELAGRRLPRRGAGLWLAIPNPLSRHRTLVIQLGDEWGAHLPDNHRYDTLPDVLAYQESASRDFWSAAETEILAAGFVSATGQIKWLDTID